MVLDRRHRHNHFLLLVRVCRSFSHFVLRQLQMTSVSYSTPANFNSRLDLNATKKNDPLFNDADTCGGAQSSLNQSKTTTERKKKKSRKLTFKLKVTGHIRPQMERKRRTFGKFFKWRLLLLLLLLSQLYPKFRPWKTTRKVKKIRSAAGREEEKRGKKSRAFWNFCSFSFPTVWEKKRSCIYEERHKTHTETRTREKKKDARRTTRTQSPAGDCRTTDDDGRRKLLRTQKKRRGDASAAATQRAPALFTLLFNYRRRNITGAGAVQLRRTDWSSSALPHTHTHPDILLRRRLRLIEKKKKKKKKEAER